MQCQYKSTGEIYAAIMRHAHNKATCNKCWREKGRYKKGTFIPPYNKKVAPNLQYVNVDAGAEMMNCEEKEEERWVEERKEKCKRKKMCKWMNGCGEVMNGWYIWMHEWMWKNEWMNISQINTPRNPLSHVPLPYTLENQKENNWKPLYHYSYHPPPLWKHVYRMNTLPW